MDMAIIGVCPLWDDERESLWMLPGYMDALSMCGALPMMLPLTTDEIMLAQIADTIDGLLLTGGHDVNPILYGEEPIDQCGSPSDERDVMDIRLLYNMIDRGKPVLGICRGLQLMNVAFGGSLYQDLPTQHTSGIEHHMSPPYDRGVHEVDILPDTRLHSIIGESRLCVNSYHHQAIKQLAPALNPSAVSEDGLIEGIELPGDNFVLAVQWHPEFRFHSDHPSLRLFHSFASSITPDIKSHH